MSLLEQAKSISPFRIKKTKYNPEEIELALAYARNEVNVAQISKILEGSYSMVYSFLAQALAQYIRSLK